MSKFVPTLQRQTTRSRDHRCGSGPLPFRMQNDEESSDGFLNLSLKRSAAGWIASLLEVARIVEIDRESPGRIRVVA